MSFTPQQRQEVHEALDKLLTRIEQHPAPDLNVTVLMEGWQYMHDEPLFIHVSRDLVTHRKAIQAIRTALPKDY